MDENGPEEAAPDTEEALSTAEETHAGDGSLEGPREEREGVAAETEQPSTATQSIGEVAETEVQSVTEKGEDKETALVQEMVKEGASGNEQQENRDKDLKESGNEAEAGEEDRSEREEEVGEGREERGGEGESAVQERVGEEVGKDPVQQQSVRHEEGTPKETRKKERERKKAEKKSKKKSSKQSHEETPGSPAKQQKKAGLGERYSQRTDGGEMEAILLALFQPFDPDSSGSVDSTTFWEVIQSADFNLQLDSHELATLQEIVTADRSGLIPYAEFAAHASDIIASLYQDKPPSEEYRVRMATPSGNRVLSYDKQTGQFQDLVEEGIDPFEENIQSLYQSVDTQGRGYITRDEFITLFELDQLQLLNEEDRSQMLQDYDEVVPSGQAQYTDFYPLGKEIILRFYRHQDTSDSEWVQLQSDHLGRYQMNKYTGEIHRDVAAVTPQASTTHPQMDLVNQAYRQAEEAMYEKEQYIQQNRELQNQVRLLREEQEALAVQLDQTGHVLDQANAEIRQREEELVGLQAILTGKEHEIEDLKAQLVEADVVKDRLHMLEQELDLAQGEVEARDQTMEVRDSNMVTLKRQSLGVVDKLKTAWATIDARDSTIAKLQHQLKTEQNRMKTCEEQAPLLETKVAELEVEMKSTHQLLEEKTSALTATRKHLKNARERNLELEKVAEKATVTQDKLRGAETEIRTLKSLLTSKTAMVERRKRALAEARARLLEMEEKDNRRSLILADVLERTARQYQQSLQMGGARCAELMTFDPKLSLSTSQYINPAIPRPVSAPSVPPEPLPLHTSPSPHHTFIRGTSHTTHPPKVTRTYTMPADLGKSAPTTTRTTHTGGLQQSRAAAIPKLPPIQRRGHAKRFHIPTERELLEAQRQRDREIVQHRDSNPRCTCQLCTAGGATQESLEGGVRLDEQVDLAGLSGRQENTLARQLNIGQRVLVTMKRSEFDLEPRQCTGIVKYVGKIDSEYIDNRVYVGVKLDEPIGDTDGLVKGKRYFHCPAKHGKVVQLSNVLAVLPRKSVSYRPLQISKNSNPYSTTSVMSSSHKRSRVRVT